MKRPIFASLLPAVAILAGPIISSTGFAAVPAPPVIQQQGIPDGVFNNLSEPVCRSCHNQNPPAGIPVNPTYLPNRHHLKVGLTIPATTVRPNPDPNGDGVIETTYQCLSCHSMVYDPATYTYGLVQNFRDCMNCHRQTAGATPHHLTAWAAARNCKACHGGVINNFDDGHTIPTYQPSLVTPWPSGKPNGDNTVPANSAGTFAGNCNFCHNTHDGQPGKPLIDGGSVSIEPSWLQKPDGGGPVIVSVYQNAETHHSTGLAIVDSTRCAWCHDMAAPAGYAVRRCEECHGIATLHNITKDTNGDGVKPGAELPGYSHTGAQSDCWGCHGNNGVIMAAPGGGPGIPALYSVSASTIAAGSTTPITLTGINFTNYIENPMTGTFDILVGSNVKLTDSAGIVSILTPTSITETSMTVSLPVTIAPGSYQITATKGPSDGNPLNIAVTPVTAITNATCVKATKTLTINGARFGQYLVATDSGTSVTMNGVKGTVTSWTDTQIKARFPSCPTKAATATVDTIFDAVSASVIRK
jgi:hypothetical protein